MKHILARLVCAVALASIANGQASDAPVSDYLGPGILTGGVDNIGSRSGEQVDLRVYADVMATYDNGLQPVSVDSKGTLVQVGGLYGIDAGLGAYGVHSWRTAQLGLDYQGDFRHYFQDSYYDSSNHRLTLGYTYQKSRRLYFDLRELAERTRRIWEASRVKLHPSPPSSASRLCCYSTTAPISWKEAWA